MSFIDGPPAVALSKSEREVLDLAIAGRSNKAIARERGCAVRTVANLLGRAYKKLGVSSRTEAASKLATAVPRAVRDDAG